MKNKFYEFGSMATVSYYSKALLMKKGFEWAKQYSLIFHNKLLALEEADLLYIHQTLETLGSTYSFEKYGSGADEHVFTKNIFTAHPKIDKETKELIGYGCDTSNKGRI